MNIRVYILWARCTRLRANNCYGMIDNFYYILIRFFYLTPCNAAAVDGKRVRFQ